MILLSSTAYATLTPNAHAAETTPQEKGLSHIDFANSWVSKASMPSARGGLGVAVVDGKIYAIGGSAENGVNPNSVGTNYKAKGWIVDANEQYDPATNTWKTKTALPTPRTHFAIATYQGKIYCIGGVINYLIGSYTNVTGINEVYDPLTDSWETKSPMPTTIEHGLQANVVEDKIYLIGAYLNQTLNLAYTPQTDLWETKTPISVPVGDYASVVVDGKIYVFGAKNLNEPLTQIYDPKTDSWSFGKPSPYVDVFYWALDAAAVTTGEFAPKRIYCLSNMPASNQVYDPKTDSWSVGANVTINRDFFGVALVNDILYAIGGKTSTYSSLPPEGPTITITQNTANKQYTPIGYGTPDPTYQTPTPAVSFSPTPSPSPTPTSTPPTSSPTPTQQPTQLASPTPLMPDSDALNLSTIVSVIVVAAVVAIVIILAYLKKRR